MAKIKQFEAFSFTHIFVVYQKNWVYSSFIQVWLFYLNVSQRQKQSCIFFRHAWTDKLLYYQMGLSGLSHLILIKSSSHIILLIYFHNNQSRTWIYNSHVWYCRKGSKKVWGGLGCRSIDTSWNLSHATK